MGVLQQKTFKLIAFRLEHNHKLHVKLANAL